MADDDDWVAKAERAVKAVVDDSVALHIREILHPTGKNGDLKSLVVEKDGTGAAATIVVRWNGGATGAVYTTEILWRFNRTDHLSSKVVSETSPIKAKDENKTQMDDYLRKTIFPKVKAASTQPS